MYHAHKVKSLTCDLLVLGLYLQTQVAQVFDPVQFSRGGNTLLLWKGSDPIETYFLQEENSISAFRLLLMT